MEWTRVANNEPRNFCGVRDSHRQTDRQRDRQTDRQTETHTQTNRQKDKKTDRQTHTDGLLGWTDRDKEEARNCKTDR